MISLLGRRGRGVILASMNDMKGFWSFLNVCFVFVFVDPFTFQLSYQFRITEHMHFLSF